MERTPVIEKDPDTGLYVGYLPSVPGAHSQGATLKELEEHLREVFALLAEAQMDREQ